MANYSNPSFEDISEIFASYGLQLVSSTPLDGGMTNSSFKLTDIKGDDYLFTVLDNHDAASAQNLVATLEYLRSQNFPAETFCVQEENGAALSEWNGTPCLLKPFIQGSPLHQSDDIPAFALGQMMGFLHTLNKPYPKHLNSHTRRIPENWEAELGFHDCYDLKHLLSRVTTFEKLPDFTLNAPVMCHGDLFLDNVIRSDEGPMFVIDWETACIDHPLVDVGATLTSFRLQTAHRGEAPIAEIKSFGEGYDLATGYRFSVTDLIRATDYMGSYFAYMRYVRHNITHPDATKADCYKEIVELPTLGLDHWPAAMLRRPLSLDW